MERIEVQGAMANADGSWRVEAIRRISIDSVGHQSLWYRIVHDGNVIDWLSITEVQRILTEAGIDMAELQEVA